jgi:hypothetical protein
MTSSTNVSWGTAFRKLVRFGLAAFALSALTFGLVGLNRYFDGVWKDVPNSPAIFTVQGQLFWLTLTLIAVITGTFILGALALAFPWALVEGAELRDLWKVWRGKKKP